MFWLFYVLFEKWQKSSACGEQKYYENADSTFAKNELYFRFDNQMVAEMQCKIFQFVILHNVESCPCD